MERRYCRIFLPLVLSRYAMRFTGLAVILFGIFAIAAVPLDIAFARPHRPTNYHGIVVGFGATALFSGMFVFFHWADRTTQRLGEGAHLLWLIGPIFGIVLQVIGLAVLFMTPAPRGTLGGGGAPPGGAYIVLTLLSIGFGAYVQYTMIRAGFAIGGMTAEERHLIRETLGAPRRKGLMWLWGMPPTYEFARRGRWHAAGLILLALASGSFFALATFLSMWLPSWYSFGDGAPVALAVMLALLAAFVVLGTATRHWLQRKVTISLTELRDKDPRPPLLFLRTFAADQVPLAAPRLPFFAKILELGRIRTNLDRTLLEEGTPYAPVVALGKPGDPVPPFGAARKYLSPDNWQGEVGDLAAESAAIAICVDDTDGIWWEVEHLIAHRHIARTLFLVDPKHRAPAANAELFAVLVHKLELAGAAQLAVADDRRPRIIGFHLDTARALTVLTSSTFSHYAYLLAVRQFLRARFGAQAIPLPASAAA